MLEALLSGLIQVFQWPAIGYLLLGVVIGIWLGAVPGLGGIIGLVLLLPFTFTMEPVPAFALLLGMYAVTTTSDTIASVMLGIPGTAASQATILDGYPLAQQGHAARAFGAAFTVSAFGGVFGALVLAASLPIILPVIRSFQSPELFMLAVLGLTMVGSLSGKSFAKGLVAACLGLLISTIGYADAVAIPRYYFGSDYLLDGMPLIPIVLGLFALPEVMDLAIRDTSISRVPRDQAKGGGMLEGIKDAFRHKWLAARCAVIGTYIGMLPGLGGAIVDWVAYGHAVQGAKDKSKFGKGDIRGVIAPEAANNAMKGGSLLPTVAFGIPGSLGASILLGALLIQGLKPGPEMLTTKLDLTFSMVWAIVIANIVAAGLLMVFSRQIAKMAFMPGHLIVPGVVVFVFMGAWLGGASMGDWISCIAAGVVGYIMKQGGWPRPPLVLALILGGIMENAFQLSLRAHGGTGWITRPIVLIIAAIIVFTIFMAVRAATKSRRDGDHPVLGEGAGQNPILSTPFSFVLFGTFGWALLTAQQWPNSVSLFPTLVTIPALIFVAIALFQDSRALTSLQSSAGSFSAACRLAFQDAMFNEALQFFGYLVTTLLLSLVIGQKLALTLFFGMYLWRWGKYGWRVSIGYALGGWLLLVLFYDRVMHLFWHQSWLAEYLPQILPEWLPKWLFV